MTLNQQGIVMMPQEGDVVTVMSDSLLPTLNNSIFDKIND